MDRTSFPRFAPAHDTPLGFAHTGAPGLDDFDHAAMRTRALALGGGSGMDASLRAYLSGYGIDVRTVPAGEQIRKHLVPGRVDLVLLDLTSQPDEGLRLCPWVRQVVPDVPVIVLAPPDDFTSRVLALDMGADDSLARPFESRELVARIHAVMRRHRPRVTAANADTFDDWTFDRTQRQLVMRSGAVVRLSAYEGRLLSALIEHPGQVLGRERLLGLAHGSARQVTYRSVDLAISRLRAKMGDDADAMPAIRTIRGEGYLFSAPAPSTSARQAGG
ncbi:winged helix-turn-helix domain-containing protein [Caenimonas aquaedulcis]|uniref:Response regulator transcription factor n=1 Tax=Caenimonas aquaedulcis TaxID=2793270 RepID=A0A931MJ37_9BURK|nr:response regulator transcription factor [Caenimonas aquaedulcis]MBG9390677.1 response regulator transcription factor [Caenimonas aquaedulcis]